MSKPLIVASILCLFFGVSGGFVIGRFALEKKISGAKETLYILEQKILAARVESETKQTETKTRFFSYRKTYENDSYSCYPAVDDQDANCQDASGSVVARIERAFSGPDAQYPIKALALVLTADGKEDRTPFDQFWGNQTPICSFQSVSGSGALMRGAIHCESLTGSNSGFLRDYDFAYGDEALGLVTDCTYRTASEGFMPEIDLTMQTCKSYVTPRH